MLLVAAATGAWAPSCRESTPDTGERRGAVIAPMGIEALKAHIETLRPLHRPLAPPQPGEWLHEHAEPGQSFAEYVASDPVVPDEERRILYVQPLGGFSEEERRVVDLTAEFLGIYFGLPVFVLPSRALDDVPEDARRRHPAWGMRQLRTGWVLHDVLEPALPGDALALIAITRWDLWPGEGWNFVFGQASLRGRVGVWSIYRFGDPAFGPGDFRRCLRRTVAVASHELGHMLSMKHCTAYRCNMQGSNSLEETDEGPLALCPECLAKLLWATGADPVVRFRDLEAFARRHGLDEEADFYRTSRRRLTE